MRRRENHDLVARRYAIASPAQLGIEHQQARRQDPNDERHDRKGKNVHCSGPLLILGVHRRTPRAFYTVYIKVPFEGGFRSRARCRASATATARRQTSSSGLPFCHADA